MYQESFFLKMSLSVVAVLISSIILLLYYSKKISLIEAIVYSFATQTYSIPFVGATITTFFLVTFFLSIDELFFLIKNNIKIKKLFLWLFLLPVISVIFTIGFYFLSPQPYQYIVSTISFFLTPFLFYIKTFAPFFLIGNKVYRYFKTSSVNKFILSVQKVILVSCCIATMQMLIDPYIINKEIKELLGIKMLYQGYEGRSIRLQAFFMEPKLFSAFIGLSIPVLLKNKKYFIAIFAIIIGILTRSQTFIVILLLCFICFIIFKNQKYIRQQILYSLLLIIGIFFLISQFQQPMISYFHASKGSVFYNFILERAIDRYRDNELDLENNNEVLGMPLQKDLELPVYKFFAENPVLLLFGYGPGFSQFLPPKYFEDVPFKYDQKLKGGQAQHMNMRWFYYIAEFGLIIFLFFFFILTSVQFTSDFNRTYYSYMWLIFFFNEIDYFLIIFYVFAIAALLKPSANHNEVLLTT